MWYRIGASTFWIVVLSAVVSVFPGCGCPDDYGPAILGQLETNLPNNRLIFSDVTVGKATVREFILYNSGNIELPVEEVEVRQKKGGIFTLLGRYDWPVVLRPGIENGIKLKVQMLPPSSGAFAGRLVVHAPNADNVDSAGNFFVDLRNQYLAPDPRFKCAKTLNFGAVEKGSSKTLTCNVFNAGTADFVINKVSYVPEKGTLTDFRWDTKAAFPIVVPVGGKGVDVAITYQPSDYPPVEDQGLFVLESNASVSQRIRVIGTTSVALVELVPLYPTCKSNDGCKAIDRRLTCTQDNFDNTNRCLPRKDATPFLLFPLTSKGKVTVQRFAIRSTGEQPLEIQNIALESSSSGDFKVIQDGRSYPLKLSPKKQLFIAVEYAPSDAIEDSGAIVITSNAANRPKGTVLLEASSRGCNLEVSPRSHTFRAPKPPLTVNIINNGNESCVLKRVYLKSESKDTAFALLPTPQSNQTIVPNGRVDFLVNFNPKEGFEYKDVVVIESSDPDEPIIEIGLRGQTHVDAECEIEATPRRLVFGLVGTGRSKKLSISITNLGWGTCYIRGLQVVGTKPAGNAAFQLVSQVKLPIRMSSGSNIRLQLEYTPPTDSTGYEGKLYINSDNKRNPTYTVELVGSSGTLCLEVVPSAMDFGSSKFGCSTPTRKVEVYNLGNAKCQKQVVLQKIGLAPGTTPEFRIMSAPSTPHTLGPGEGISVAMSYKPKTVGIDSGSLEVETNVLGQSPATVPLVGEGVSTDDQKDVFKQLQRPLVDILFVVDDSGSMGDDQDALAKNFNSFISWAVRLNVDYQIMVTTTDTTGAGGGPGCARGNPKVVTPQTPNPVTTFQRNVRVGTTGSASEKGLEAAYRALIPPASTGCNRGFYRAPASLSMIFVSDEEDQSPQSVQFYMSFFKSMKGFRNLDLIRASVVVGPPPNGCRGSGGGAGFAASAPRYWKVAQELKGSQQSLCTQNWASTLNNLAAISFGYRSEFYLSRQADPKTLVVKVNGSVILEDAQNGWSYESTSNAVRFSKTKLPAPGATIQVEYKAICLP